MDERRISIGARAMGMTLVITYFYILIVAISKYVNTKDITNSAWEIGLLVLIPFSILWFSRKDESIMLPKKFRGSELPIGSDVKTRKQRKKHYAIDSIGLSIGFAIVTMIAVFFIEKDEKGLLLFSNLNKTLNWILIVGIEVIVGFIVFYAIAYIWGEWSIKRYNRKLDELEVYDE
jgi:hypothetical protein